VGAAEREARGDVQRAPPGGDPGHAPARATYEGLGFQHWPVALYFKDLADGD